MSVDDGGCEGRDGGGDGGSGGDGCRYNHAVGDNLLSATVDVTHESLCLCQWETCRRFE